MPDRYPATIQMWPWRTKDPAIRRVARWLTGNYGPLQEADGNESLGAPIVSPDGKLSLSLEEACDGVDEFRTANADPEGEFSLVRLMQAARLTFVARDERRDGGGREMSWRPGLPMVRERLLVGGVPALAQPTAELLLDLPSSVRLRTALENYFAPIESCSAEGAVQSVVHTEAVVGGCGVGSPKVLFASPGAEVLVVPPFLEDERDVYSPEDVLKVAAAVEGLRAFAWSEELHTLALQLRRTARAFAADA